MMRIFRLLLLFGLSLQALASPAADRLRISLDGVWDFRIDPYDAGIREEWYAATFVPQGWDRIAVPGNWELRNEYADYAGYAWYRTTFETPAELAGKIVRLHFEAVNVNYSVWVNGVSVGEVFGGYFPQDFDVTRLLVPDGCNSLAVRVDNDYRTGAYMSWGGIRRPVELRIDELLRPEKIRIHADPDLDTGRSEVEFEIRIRNAGTAPKTADVVCRILKEGSLLAERRSVWTFAPGDSVLREHFHLSRKQTHLWHFDTPELYTAEVELVVNGACGGCAGTRFGIRKVAVENGAFLLNGEPVRVAGYNWVADDRFTGNTLPREVYVRQLDGMKSAGAVMARLSHVPLPDDVLDYIDEIGLLVIDEIPVWGTSAFADPENPRAFEWLERMVDLHGNHPSVVAWCVGNEIGDRVVNPRVKEYVRRAVAHVNELDPSRPAIEVSNTAHWQEDDPSQFSNGFTALNIYSSCWRRNAERVARKFQKPVYMSEFGVRLIGDSLDASYAPTAAAIAEMQGSPDLFGISLWCYNDYRSTHRSPHPLWNTPLSENRAWGIVDAYGNRKAAYRTARRSFAPVRAMELFRTSEADCRVRIVPRGVRDLPAYALRGYRIEVRDFGLRGEPLASSELPLKDIMPGDTPFDVPLGRLSQGISRRRVALCNPRGYELLDTLLCLTPPAAPQPLCVRAANGRIRVYFKRSDDATRYELHYGAECPDQCVLVGENLEMATVKGLCHGERCRLQLVAVNAAGESRSEIFEIVGNRAGYLPPEIRGISYSGGTVGIGYPVETGEYRYVVEYAPSPDFKTKVRRIATQLRGCCFIPFVPEGKTLYLRVRALRQWQIASEWSPVYRLETREGARAELLAETVEPLHKIRK